MPAILAREILQIQSKLKVKAVISLWIAGRKLSLP
jgi:hypothetical protein